MGFALEIQVIAILVSLSCALLGVFLVLRRMSMMSDSITHTILLGIVLAFWITRDLGSPWLIIGASLMGVITVWLIELLAKTRLVAADAAIGLVFPLLFSIAIIIISRYMGHLNLHTDTVLLGELAFAPFDRLFIGGIDLGARFLYTAGAMLLVNLLFVGFCYKELKLVAFDPIGAVVLGISVNVLHYGLMMLVSMTTVVAFEAVGALLVVAFMVGPPTAAYLLTKKLSWMLLWSGLFGTVSAVVGFHAAVYFDVSIAGSMAVVIGIVFALAFICSPSQGLIAGWWRRGQQRAELEAYVLRRHLQKHGNPDTLGWTPQRLKRAAKKINSTK